MEEKKFDPWQFVGFFLIALILTWMLYNQAPVEAAAAVENVNQTESAAKNAPEQSNTVVVNDSLQSNQLQASYGSFANLFQFKTTKKVEQILSNYKTEEIIRTKLIKYKKIYSLARSIRRKL